MVNVLHELKIPTKTVAFVCVFCVLLICFSCNRSRSPSDFDTIQVDLTNPQRASLFDYFKHIELIPLETNDDVVIGFLNKIIYHQNKYYILDRHRGNNVILVFCDTGKFQYNIGSQGSGPGEYILLYDMIINPFSGNIELLCPIGFIHSYDLQGNHVRSSDRITNAYLRAIHNLVAVNENTYVFKSAFNHPYQLLFYYDFYEKKIIHQEYEENSFLRGFSFFCPFYEHLGQWYFYREFDNTTYKLGSYSLIKAFTWDFGRFNYDANKMEFPVFQNLSSREEYNKRAEFLNQLPYRILVQGQNNRYIMAQIMLSGGKLGNLV